MRKLASIQVIDNIIPHPNADKLEIAEILGWQVIIKKGEFKKDDHCVYCEIDSVMPDREEFDFLRAYKFRIKTIKLRGTISQGIAFPTSILPERDICYSIDEDVTELLNITKYEPQTSNSCGGAMLRGSPRSTFPSYIPKTDETRVQSLKKEYNNGLWKDIVLIATEKMDGSSTTFGILDDEEFHVCSRNIDIKEDDVNSFWRTIRKHIPVEKESFLIEKYPNIVFQGELCGPGIQKNIYKLQELKIYVFGAFNYKERVYLTYNELEEYCRDLGLEMVPFIEELTINKFESIAAIVEYATGKSIVNSDVGREGVVFRSKYRVVPYKTCRDEDDNETILWIPSVSFGKLSFKAISNDYLLKHDE